MGVGSDLVACFKEMVKRSCSLSSLGYADWRSIHF